jgi:hypothetical protein
VPDDSRPTGPIGDPVPDQPTDATSPAPGVWHPGLIGRRWWQAQTLNDLTATTEHLVELADTDREHANLVSSLCADGTHAPALDLDHRARLVPSSTPGHAHLYIDEHLTWAQYRALLRGLHRAGLIDASVYWRSLDRQATYVRPPWVKKTALEHNRGSLDAPPDPKAAARSLRRIRRRVLCRWPRWWLASLTAKLFSRHG